MSDGSPRRVLIGGVGYRHLRDYSIGVVVTDHLSLREWPAGIEVDDLSFNPVAVSQRLGDETTKPFDSLVFVAATARGHKPGTVTAYRWDCILPDPEMVQAAVTEAVTGVIALDNTLMVVRQFGGLPNTVIVVEIEPAVEEFGEAFSTPVQKTFEDVCDLVTKLAIDSHAAEELAVLPLGGQATTGTRRD